MSGGHFDYNQYRINDIADSIERELSRQGKEKPQSEFYGDKEYFEKYCRIFCWQNINIRIFFNNTLTIW